MAVTSAKSGEFQILFLGEESKLPVDRRRAADAGLSFHSLPVDEGIRQVADCRDVGRPLDAVVIDGSSHQVFEMEHRVQDADPDVRVVLLVKSKSAHPFSRNPKIAENLLDGVLLPADQAESDTIQKLKHIAKSARHARKTQGVIGQINENIGVWRSDREKAYRKLVAPDRYLMALLANAPDALISTDGNGFVVAWNRGASELYGHSQDDMYERHISILFDDREVDRLNNCLQRAHRGEVVRAESFVCIRGNGQQWHAEVTMSAVADDRDEPLGISVISRDVSDRVAAERAREAAFAREQRARKEIELANAQLRFLAEAGSILSSSLDYETTLRRVAEVAIPHIADWAVVDMLDASGRVKRLALAHRDPAKVDSVRQLGERYQTADREDNAVRIVLNTGDPLLFTEVTDEMITAAAVDEEHLRSLRRLAPKSVMLSPITVRGKTIGVFTLATAETDRRFSDTDFKLIVELTRRASIAVEHATLFRETRELNEQLERRVQERTEQLQNTNRELEMFSYSVSHDLRSPLRAIEGFTRILLEEHGEDLTGEARRLLDVIRKNTVRMDELISDLLAFAKMTRARISRTIVDMGKLSHELYEELISGSRDRERSIEFRVGDLPAAWADPSLIRQVLENLLANAIKFTRPVKRGVIEVGAEEDEAQTTYFVRDNGVGFDMKYAAKLFEVFQRLHSSRDFEGTGIGLAIVHRIITAHGGEVWADSQEGSGTTIYFRLPKRS